MYTDADIVRMHAELKKEAFNGIDPARVLAQLRTHAPVLTGAAVGGLIAPPGKELESAASGALGAIVGGASNNPYGGYIGGTVGPIGYSLYHHLTKEEPNGNPYAG